MNSTQIKRLQIFNCWLKLTSSSIPKYSYFAAHAVSAPNEKNNQTWSWNKAKANVDYLFIMATRRECPWRMMGPVFNVKACSLWVYGYTYALCVCLPCACLLFVYPCPTLATPRPAPRSCATHISAAHLVICSSAVWTRDTRHATHATHATRNSRISCLVSLIEPRTH